MGTGDYCVCHHLQRLDLIWIAGPALVVTCAQPKGPFPQRILDVENVTCLISLPAQSLDLPHLSHITWLHFFHSTHHFLNLSYVLGNETLYISSNTILGPENRNHVVLYLSLYSQINEQGLTSVVKVFFASHFDHCLKACERNHDW